MNNSNKEMVSMQVRSIKEGVEKDLIKRLFECELIPDDPNSSTFEQRNLWFYQKKGRDNSHFFGSGIILELNLKKSEISGKFAGRYFGPKTNRSDINEHFIEFTTHYEDCIFDSNPNDQFTAGEMLNKYKLESKIMILKSKTLPNIKFYIIKDARFRMPVGHVINTTTKFITEPIPDMFVCEMTGNNEQEFDYLSNSIKDLNKLQETYCEKIDLTETAPSVHENKSAKNTTNDNNSANLSEIKLTPKQYLKKVIQLF